MVSNITASIPLRKQTHVRTHAAPRQFTVIFQMYDLEFEGENPISTVWGDSIRPEERPLIQTGVQKVPGKGEPSESDTCRAQRRKTQYCQRSPCGPRNELRAVREVEREAENGAWLYLTKKSAVQYFTVNKNSLEKGASGDWQKATEGDSIGLFLSSFSHFIPSTFKKIASSYWGKGILLTGQIIWPCYLGFVHI